MKLALLVLLVAVAMFAAWVALPPERNTSKRPEVMKPELASACRTTGDWLARQLGDECPVIVREPFVIGGNLTKAELERRYQATIAPAARAMAAQYFSTSPDEPITLLLFDGEAAYRDYANRLLGVKRPPSYGFYRPHLRTVIVNTAAGEKSLLHELTHALMAFDFPDPPDWFGEGLASLHEQCRVADGRLVGLSGGRLEVLRSAIAEGRPGSLEALVRSDGFHAENESLNYAQARYFCLYMQEQGLLTECYRLLRAGRKRDPSGRDAVSRVFPNRSWAELDADFRRWIKEL